MNSLFRSIRSDFYKLKRTPIPLLHILVPLLGAGLFLTYFTTVGPQKDPSGRLGGYLEILSICFPLLSGLICGMTIAQEEQAGDFQNVLGEARSREIAFLSKFLLLIILAIFSVVLAVGVFAVSFQNASPLFYLKAAGALLLGNLICYILSLVVSFRFGRSASIGLGITGLVLSAVMLTGLGDKIWRFVPWAWSVRFCDYLVLQIRHPAQAALYAPEIHQGFGIMIAAVCASLLASLLWFRNWEGRKTYE